MKKFISILLILSFCLVGCSNENNNSQNSIEENTNYNYTASRTSTPNENNSANNVVNVEAEKEPEPPPETDISSFSTKIYTPNDSARQTNIGLTCSKLNGTIVKSRRNIFFL